MTCHEFTDRLPALLDGTLSRRDAAALRRHARQCAACHGYESEYRSTVAILQELAEWPVDARHEETVCAADLAAVTPWLHG